MVNFEFGLVNTKNVTFLWSTPHGTYILPQGGGGVLRYISDGDVQSPFLGLKFTI